MAVVDGRVVCEHDECDASYHTHKWDAIKEGENWFQQKDGTAWCPQHIPDWVAEWRKRKKANG